MRTISELKTAIAQARKNHTFYGYMEAELRRAIIDGIPSDRLEAICDAERERITAATDNMVISTSQATHNLKILPPYYDASAAGLKTFEIRLDDRGYKIGDILHLQEWSGTAYTGRSHCMQVTYILRDKPYVPDGYVCMGVIPIRSYGALRAEKSGRIFDPVELAKVESD